MGVCRGVQWRAVWGWGSGGQALAPFVLMGKLRLRKSLRWNGISLAGQVGRVPVACSAPGARMFLCSSEGFEVGIREVLRGFKGHSHLRASSTGPPHSQLAGWGGPDSSPSPPLARLWREPAAGVAGAGGWNGTPWPATQGPGLDLAVPSPTGSFAIKNIFF